MTLNQIVNKIRGFALAHKSLKGRFFEGTLSEYCCDKSQPYPALTMTILPSIINDGIKSYSAQFGVWDRTELDFSNRLEVQSDTELICQDLIAFVRNMDGTEIDLPVTIDHHEEKFDDAVSGSFFTLNINQYHKIDYCAIPLDITDPVISVTPLTLEFEDTEIGLISDSQTITVSGRHLTNDIVITAPIGFIINLDNGSQNDGPITLTAVDGSVPDTLIYVSFQPLTAVEYTEEITVTSTGAEEQDVDVTGTGVNPQVIVAEGGIITRTGNRLVHEYPAGVVTFNVISNEGGFSADALIVAGGGAGGATTNGGAGGGGGGGVKSLSLTPAAQIYTGTVGAGGTIVTGDAGNNGVDSVFLSQTAFGGGGGGNGGNDIEADGKSGASAGGNGFGRTIRVATSIPGQGHDGGVTTGDGGAGGGGAGSVGQDTSTEVGGNGGAGFASSITGTLKHYGAGGAGGSYVSVTGGIGGSGEGGNGAYGTGGIYNAATSGTTPGAAGGGAANVNPNSTMRSGAPGKDGAVYISYVSDRQVDSYNFTMILNNE